MTEDISRYLAGEALYGDDFDEAQIVEWFEGETEGYSSLGAGNRATYIYEYHAWNTLHAYRYLPAQRYPRALGFGSAYGEELIPMISQIDAIDVVDASARFSRPDLQGVPLRYTRALHTGELPFDSGTFSLITCLGVLHHIPNVSFVVAELARVLAPGGFLIIREPIVTMGDWRLPRRGLTKSERGIPLALMRDIVGRTKLHKVNEALCSFTPAERLYRMFRRDIYNSPVFSRMDQWASKAFAWNVNYHPTRFVDLFRPTSAFFLLSKSDEARAA